MELREDYVPDTAIVSLWYGLNYGSILSAYALYRTVEEMGYKPVLVSKPAGMWGAKYSDPENIAGRFIHKNCYVSPEFYDGQSLAEFTSQRKNFIVGPDVCWSHEICGREAGGFFFLDFVPGDKNKISYACSFGSGYETSGEVVRRTEGLLKKISHRSVGDMRALEILNLKFGMEAEMVIDPLFLMEGFQRETGNELGEKCLFAYMENCDAQKRKMIKMAENLLKCPVKNYADVNNYENSAARFEMPVQPEADIEEWVSAIRDAQYVITDSYSAMCMAIIFQKNFLVMAPKTMPDLNRFTGLLEALGLMERMVYVEDDMSEYYYLLKKPVRYQLVNERLEQYKKTSREWLESSLKNMKQE